MIGARFGKLTVIGVGVTHHRPIAKTMVPCRCDCGAERLILISNLNNPKTCFACKYDSVRNKLKTHGRLPRYMYRIWLAMRNRCMNPRTAAWPNYGGRGIAICERWNSFEAFRDDMGPRPSPSHTLDRIDNEKGYSPDNCRWATRLDQTRNRRTTRWLSAFGETKTLLEWAKQCGINQWALRKRLAAGWEVQDALTRPLRR